MSSLSLRSRFVPASLGLAGLVLTTVILPGCAARPNAAEASAPTSGKVTSLDQDAPAPQQPLVSSTSTGAVAPLTTLDEAQSAYADAQRDLDSLLGSQSGGLALDGTVDDDRPPKAAPPPAPTAEASELKKEEGRCQRVCLALASLERARDAICRITSMEDERCTRATTSVDKNRERAKVCACPESESEGTSDHDE